MRPFSGVGLFFAASLFASWASARGAPVEPTASPPSLGETPPALPPTTSAPAVASSPSAGAAAGSTAVPLAPPGWQTSDIGWLNRYTVARERLLAGDFVEARELLAALVATATTGLDRAIAQELEVLAGHWASREVVMVRRADLGESGISAKAAGDRTTDEIVVLYTGAVVYGLGTGAWIDVLTEPNSAAGVILPALGLAGASVGAVALIDSQKRLRYGVPQSIVSGMYIGLEEGLALTLWNQARVSRSDEWSARSVATALWGFTTAGAAAGAIVGNVGGTTPGGASFVGSAAMWSGLITGMLVGGLVPSDEKQDETALLASVVGLNAGVIAGVLAAGPVSPSIARVRVLDLGGIAGGLVVGGLYLSAAGQESSPNGFLGLTSLGIGGGLVTAWLATAGMEPDRLPSPTARSSNTPSSMLANATMSVTPTLGGAALGLRGAF